MFFLIRIGHLPILHSTGHETGRILLRQMYRELRGTEPPEIAVSDRGKPYFPGSPVYFSITHTPHHAFCVLSDTPVGIDAEELGRRVSPKLARKVLSAAELARYEQAADPGEAFLRMWVLKEALVKCRGDGLRGYPNFTDFSPEDPRIQVLEGCFVAILTKEDSHAL